VPVPARALLPVFCGTAGTSRYLLRPDRVRDRPHLTRVVAQPVVALFRSTPIVSHSAINHLSRRTRLILVACIGPVIVFADSTVVKVALAIRTTSAAG
jgi:hypothetical protein